MQMKIRFCSLRRSLDHRLKRFRISKGTAGMLNKQIGTGRDPMKVIVVEGVDFEGGFSYLNGEQRKRIVQVGTFGKRSQIRGQD